MPDGKGGYGRQIIDDKLVNGHALTLVDVDGDGIPEIVAGGNGSSSNMFFYKATDATGQVWTRYQMDDDMAPASCVTADIKSYWQDNDVVCQDMRAPYWLKWYEYNGKLAATCENRTVSFWLRIARSAQISLRNILSVMANRTCTIGTAA